MSTDIANKIKIQKQKRRKLTELKGRHLFVRHNILSTWAGTDKLCKGTNMNVFCNPCRQGYEEEMSLEHKSGITVNMKRLLAELFQVSLILTHQ